MYINQNKQKLDERRGYSLIELLIAMFIFGVIMIMFTQIMMSALKVSQENYVRAKFRSSITDILDLVKRDIRNADFISDCMDSTCTIEHNKKYVWKICEDTNYPNSICKYEEDGAGEKTLIKMSEPTLFVTSFQFNLLPVSGVESESGFSNNTVIVTIQAIALSHVGQIEEALNGELPIDVRQVIISTRNVKI